MQMAGVFSDRPCARRWW